MKLMDSDGNGQITCEAFKTYIDVILAAIKKVNPGLSEEEPLSETDKENLFKKISNGEETFKLDDFRKVYKEKIRFPEISWIDYFKSNDDSLVLINNNIKDLIRIFKEFSERAIEILGKVVQCLSKEGEWSILNDIEDLTNKFNKFSSEIEDKKEKFLLNINRLNIKDILFKPLSEHLEHDYRPSHVQTQQQQDGVDDDNNNDDEHNCNENTNSQMNVPALNDDEGSHKDNNEQPQLISANNKHTIPSHNNDNNELASMRSKSYVSNQFPNLRQSQMTVKNGQMNNQLAKTNVLTEKRNEYISRFFHFIKDQINNINNNNNIYNASHYSGNNNSNQAQSEIISSCNSYMSNNFNTNENDILDECITINKVNQMPLFQGLNMLNANVENPSLIFNSQPNINVSSSHHLNNNNNNSSNNLPQINNNNPNNSINNNSNVNLTTITFTKLLCSLQLFLLSSFNSMTLMDESYEWIRNNYLKREFSKIEKAKKDQKKIMTFRKENIPKKNKKNAIKSTEEKFNILLNMIIGIHIAVTNTPNEKLELTVNPQQDLSNYFISSNYSVQITNFGSKQQASYYLKQYAGIIFNNIRLRFGFDKEKFISSISPQDFVTEIMISARTIFEELCSSGKSGSLFYYTRDGKFILKTISQEEYMFLKKILPNYFRYVCENPDTLLPKFLGCYKLIKKMKNNKKKEKYRFIIMMNIFCTDRQIHKRYDLKGSKRGRQVIKTPLEEKIKSGDYALKDKDLDIAGQKANVGNKRERFMKQLTKDANFLRDNNAIDYSLLFGLHNVNDSAIPSNSNTNALMMQFSKTFKANANKNGMIKPIVNDESNYNNMNGSGKCILSHSLTLHHHHHHVNTNSNTNLDKKLGTTQMRGSIIDVKEINPQVFNPLSTLSDAQTDRAVLNGLQDLEDGGMWSADKNNIYYFGIIDILTEYNCRKKAEYVVKLVGGCSNDMSCVPPEFYRDRFVNYVNTIIINNEDNHSQDNKT